MLVAVFWFMAEVTSEVAATCRAAILKDWRDNDKDYLQYEKEDDYEILGEGVSDLISKLKLDYKDDPLNPQHVYSVELW